jgi:hypothetical protein
LAVFDIDLRRYHDLPAQERRAIDAWFAEQFAHTEFVWAEKPWRVLARHQGALVGHMGLVRRNVMAGGRLLAVGGIAGVMTRVEERRRGVATTMLGQAADFMRAAWDVEFGLLLCRAEVEPLHRRSGWRRVEGRTYFEQPSGRTLYPRLTMVLPLRGGIWPEGDIDLCGLPW